MLVFNHTGHIFLWNGIIDTMESFTKETIFNTTAESVSRAETVFSGSEIAGLPIMFEDIEYNYIHRTYPKLKIKFDNFACEYAEIAHTIATSKGRKAESGKAGICFYCPLTTVTYSEDYFDCMCGLYTACDRLYADAILTLFDGVKVTSHYTINQKRIDKFFLDIKKVITFAMLIRDFPVRANIITDKNLNITINK